MKNLKTFKSFASVNEDHDEISNYMFLQNLKTIKKCVERMLALDPKSVDQLMNEHDWASDHISTSKDDVEEVCNFLCNMLGDHEEDNDEKNITQY
jgi:hypothetical protein